jgi:DNA-directed RNA polymerase specialized sigma24 family protein
MGRLKELVEGSPESEDRARFFAEWYGANMDKLRYYLQGRVEYDEDIFSDAFLRAYDAIARKGTTISNNTSYFLQTYRTTYLDIIRKSRNMSKVELRDMTSPDIDTGEHEREVWNMTKDILLYLREYYNEVDISIFEIYAGLSPDVSYKRMSHILGIPINQIYQVVSSIKKDVVKRFGERYNFLLSNDGF